MESTLKRTWAEIDLDHLTHNFEVIRRRVGDKVKLLGVVKADGYGHGAVEIAKRLEQLGAGYLAVSNIDECEELRDSGVTLPILMLGLHARGSDGAHFAAAHDAGGAELRHRKGIFRPRHHAGREDDRARQARHRHGPPRLFVRRGAL